MAEIEAVRAQSQLALSNVDLSMSSSSKAIEEVKDQSRRLELYQTQLMREALAPLATLQQEMKEMGRNLAAQTALLERVIDEWDMHRHRDHEGRRL